MKERLFKFKQFSVSHSQSAMKVGVDGVLVGAWAKCEGERILDAGCGCGLIALMIAQRNPDCLVEGIDIDKPSVEEASHNVECSPWSGRVRIKEMPFDSITGLNDTERYDLIVSNPPFFDSGVTEPLTPRERSRHQGSLSPRALVKSARNLLTEKGRLALIAPAVMMDPLKDLAEINGLLTSRICYVRDNERVVVKRVLMEFRRGESHENNSCSVSAERDVDNGPAISCLTLFQKSGEPTPEYRTLCSDFYLKF